MNTIQNLTLAAELNSFSLGFYITIKQITFVNCKPNLSQWQAKYWVYKMMDIFYEFTLNYDIHMYHQILHWKH